MLWDELMSAAYNDYVLTTSLEQGWIKPEQANQVRVVITANPQVAALDLMEEQQLLPGELVQMLRDLIALGGGGGEADTCGGVLPPAVAARTSAAVLGIEPPDKFPLMFYRDNAADIQLSIDDVLHSPIHDTQVFQFAGTNLSREPSRSATIFAAEMARQAGATVVLDVDFRPGQWHDPRAFGVAIRSVLRLVDIVIGTEDEVNAALLADPAQLHVTHDQQSDARVAGDTEQAIATILTMGPRALVLKTGSAGARVYLKSGEVIAAPGFPVEIYNILGAGDAFGGGFLYGYVNNWGWYKSARLGNACGAIVVTKHGCANFMPTMPEIDTFVAGYGGLD
jgi:5-dehydro-2-deoxygluconokinase